MHQASCKLRCINCSSAGPKYRCMPYPNYMRKCTSCDKTFLNRSCFELHIKKKYCNKSKKCSNQKCGVTRNWRSEHICCEKYCLKCERYNKDGVCIYRVLHGPKKGGPARSKFLTARPGPPAYQARPGPGPARIGPDFSFF